MAGTNSFKMESLNPLIAPMVFEAEQVRSMFRVVGTAHREV
jgi:hypothetical protein